MCCDAPESALLPPPVAAMRDEYGSSTPSIPTTGATRWMPSCVGKHTRYLGAQLVGGVFDGLDCAWPDVVRRCLTDPLPAGLIVASLDVDGVSLRIGPRP